jgi:hypothetical protein
MNEIKDILPGRKEICLLIQNAFNEEFCDEVIEMNKDDFTPANLNYPSSYRNNERQVKDDLAFSEILFEEIKKYIPSVIEIEGISHVEHGTWILKCLNERIRICRYDEGQYFNKHLDGVYYRSKSVQSKLTFMIYLNGGNKEFEGGRTLFFPSKEDDEVIGYYEPSKGDLIIFDHNLWHSGEEVIGGEKYILRSDILYEKDGVVAGKETGKFIEGHLGYIWKIISDGTDFYTAGRDRLIKAWDKKGNKIEELSGHKNSILDMISISPNVLISCSRDRSIIIWKREPEKQFKEVHNLKFHESTVLGLAKINNHKFVSCGADGMLNLIDLKGNLLESFKAHNEWIWSIRIISNEVVATVGEDGFLRIWRLDPIIKLGEIKMKYPLTAIEYNKENRILYVGGINGRIVGVKVEEDLSIRKIFDHECHQDKVWVIKCARDYVASGGEDNKVIIWGKDNMKKLKEYNHKNFVQDLIWTDDGIISVSYDGEIRELK